MDTPFCFLNVNKPRGITSFDVIYKLRKILNIKQIGHAGTLDPMAEGVMQIGVGKAAKLLQYLPSDKTYTAEIKFGFNSSTLDLEGEVTPAKLPNFTRDELVSVLEGFKGEIIQTPPKYSAIKVNGQKLCDIARKHPEKEIEVPKRIVKVHNISLLNFSKNGETTAEISVECSKGTYIRTLAQDIAVALDTGAYLTKLIRTRAGNFKLENSCWIEDIDIEKDGIPPQEALSMNRLELSEKEFDRIKNGAKIHRIGDTKENIMLIYKNRLVSIGILEDNEVRVKKFFN